LHISFYGVIAIELSMDRFSSIGVKLWVLLVLLVFLSVDSFSFLFSKSHFKSLVALRVPYIQCRSAETSILQTTTQLGLKQRLIRDMKDAMKLKEKVRLEAIRSIQAAVKQKEVDDRLEVR
jgi:hypothetical protein